MTRPWSFLSVYGGYKFGSGINRGYKYREKSRLPSGFRSLFDVSVSCCFSSMIISLDLVIVILADFAYYLINLFELRILNGYQRKIGKFSSWLVTSSPPLVMLISLISQCLTAATIDAPMLLSFLQLL